MFRSILTGPALADLREIREYGFRQYGQRVADAYDQLIQRAISDLEADPFCPTSKARDEIGTHLRTYHITHSRRSLASPIKNPKHFLLYMVTEPDRLVIVRVLHDARDLQRHVPKPPIYR